MGVGGKGVEGDVENYASLPPLLSCEHRGALGLDVNLFAVVSRSRERKGLWGSDTQLERTVALDGRVLGSEATGEQRCG